MPLRGIHLINFSMKIYLNIIGQVQTRDVIVVNK